MATFVLEDLNASIEAFVFPKTMADYGALLDDDAIVVVKARMDMRDERLKLVCMEVSRPELIADGLRDLRISLPLGTLTDRTVDDLKRLLSEHPGHSPVLLHVGREGAPPALRVQRRRQSGTHGRTAGAARPPRHPVLTGRQSAACPGRSERPLSSLVRGSEAPEMTPDTTRAVNPVKSLDGTWRG